MRDAERVYLVGMAADEGSYNGMSTHEMTLLKGNEVLTVTGVLYADGDEDALAAAWDEHVEMLAEGEQEGVELGTVTDEEADRLYAERLCGSDEDDDGVEYEVEATATGWRYTAADGSWLEIVGDKSKGTWRSELASGTYEQGEDWTGEQVMRFTEDGTEDGYLDVMRVSEDCWVKGTIW